MKMSLFLYSFPSLTLCSLGCVHVILRRQLLGSGSPFPPGKIHEGNRDNHIFWREPLPTITSHGSTTFFFSYLTTQEFDECTVTQLTVVRVLHTAVIAVRTFWFEHGFETQKFRNRLFKKTRFLKTLHIFEHLLQT